MSNAEKRQTDGQSLGNCKGLTLLWAQIMITSLPTTSLDVNFGHFRPYLTNIVFFCAFPKVLKRPILMWALTQAFRKIPVLVKWKRFIAHSAGSGGTKKHHLVKLISTAGWFMETKAPLVVNICGFLKREGQLSPKICAVSYQKLDATEDLNFS